MKKIIIGIGLLILFFLLLFPSMKRYSHPTSWNGLQVQHYTIQNHPLTLLVADTEQKWEQGLMNMKEKPQGIDGMIFLFPDTQYRTFWNKNTLLHLKLLWMNGDQLVGESDLPSVTETKDVMTVSSPKEANRVVELIQ